MVCLVGRGEHLRLVDVVDTERLQHLRLGEVTDAAFRHHRDRDRGHDFADLFRRGHTGDAAFGTNLRGDTLERHDRDRAGFFGDDGLFGGRHVHDDATFEHFGEAGFQAKAGGTTVVLGHEGHLFAT